VSLCGGSQTTMFCSSADRSQSSGVISASSAPPVAAESATAADNRKWDPKRGRSPTAVTLERSWHGRHARDRISVWRCEVASTWVAACRALRDRLLLPVFSSVACCRPPPETSDSCGSDDDEPTTLPPLVYNFRSSLSTAAASGSRRSTPSADRVGGVTRSAVTWSPELPAASGAGRKSTDVGRLSAAAWTITSGTAVFGCVTTS